MFGFLSEKHECPGCKTRIVPTKIPISRKHSIKVFSCKECGAEFVKSKRDELFQVLDEGVILC